MRSTWTNSAWALALLGVGASFGMLSGACSPAGPKAPMEARGDSGSGDTSSSAPRAGGADEAPSPTRAVFSVVATLRAPARFAAAEGRGFLLGEGPSIYDIESGAVVYDRAKIRGMERRFDAYQDGELSVITGRWPDETWLGLNQRRVHSGGSIYRWSGDRWTETLKLEGYVEDGSPWVEGHSVVIESLEDSRTRLLALPSKGAPEVPRLSDDKGHCRLRARRVRAFESGAIVVQGVACEGERPQLAVFGSGSDTVAPLPDRDGDLFGIHAMASRSANAVYFGGWSGGDDAERATGGYLAKFDGKETLLWAAPDDRPIHALSVSPGGTLWAVSRSSKGEATLWRRDGSRFVAVQLPQHEGAAVEPQQVWARGDDDVWVTAEAVGGAVVLHTAPAAVVDLPQTGASEYQSLRAPAPGCGVYLALVGKRAEPGSDYAKLRAALGEANQRVMLMEFQRRGAIYLGVVAYSEKMAQQLVELVNKALPDTPTKIVCHEPRNRVRLFVFDPKSKTWRAEQGSASQ